MTRWISRREKRQAERYRARPGMADFINGTNRLARKRIARQTKYGLDPRQERLRAHFMSHWNYFEDAVYRAVESELSQIP